MSENHAEHALERRSRSIEETYCAEPGCEFAGKRAEGGVCFNQERDARTWDKIAELAQQTSAELKQLRTEEYADRPEEYVRWLEAMYETSMMNWMSTLDECICLRVENRRLKERLGQAE